jgi:hypothetical protein
MLKVKLHLCLSKYHAMKTYGGVVVYFHTFLTSELDTRDTENTWS